MRPLPIYICNAYDLNISIFNALKEIEATIASQMLILITFALQNARGTEVCQNGPSYKLFCNKYGCVNKKLYFRKVKKNVVI